MARPREFDREELLQKAMEFFWQHGFADSSMDELVGYTGVSRYGIYSEFGNKHGLFLATLAHYFDTVVSMRIGPLETPDAGLAELREFWTFLHELADSAVANWGCLMCNTATELGPFDPEAAEHTDAYLDRMVAGFRNALRNAVKRGELGLPVDEIDDHAELMGILILGVSAAGRFERGLRAVRPAIAQILKEL